MRKLRLLLVVLTSILSQFAVAQSNSPLLLRFPTVSKTQIVFTYTDDRWIVGRDGGDARRLTSAAGIEGLPISLPTAP